MSRDQPRRKCNVKAQEGQFDVEYGVTVASTARAFLKPQLSALAENGWKVRLVTGNEPDQKFITELATAGVGSVAVPLSRRPSPVRDLASLFGLTKHFLRYSPRATVLGTPKMGVVGGIASFIARVPVRIYVLHGLRLEGEVGWKRRGLWAMERLSISVATDVVAVSGSLRAAVYREGLAGRGLISVPGAGSAGGVDTSRFQPVDDSHRSKLRSQLGIPSEAKLVGYVGRLAEDKGVRELHDSWARYHKHDPSAWLLLAGADELSGKAGEELRASLKAMPRVRILSRQDRVEEIFQALDLFVFLSRREGLGMTLLEAAACGVPAVVRRATGSIDAVVDGVTGSLVSGGDVAEVCEQLGYWLRADGRRREAGRAARAFVEANYKESDVARQWLQFLESRIVNGDS